MTANSINSRIYAVGVVVIIILLGFIILRPSQNKAFHRYLDKEIKTLNQKQDSVLAEIKKWQRPDTILINQHFQTIINEQSEIIKSNSVDADIAFFKWAFESE